MSRARVVIFALFVFLFFDAPPDAAALDVSRALGLIGINHRHKEPGSRADVGFASSAALSSSSSFDVEEEGARGRASGGGGQAPFACDDPSPSFPSAPRPGARVGSGVSGRWLTGWWTPFIGWLWVFTGWFTRSRLVAALTYAVNALAVFLAGWALGWAACSKGADRRKDSIAEVVRQLADETHPEHILHGRILKNIIGHLPKWIRYPDVDRVPWLNKAARQMWPSLDKAISVTVIEALEPVLNSLVNKAKKTTTLKFSKFTLGLEPPVLASVKVFTESEGEVGLDIEFKWGAKEPGVTLDVSVMGVVLPVALEHIEAYGTFRIIFGPLVPWWPSFSALTLAFVGKPKIDFNLKLVGGDITAVPYVSKLLEDVIKNALVELMVWPRRLFIPITEDQPDAASALLASVNSGGARPGIIRVTVERATDLPKMNSVTAARPLVEVKLNERHREAAVRVTSTARGLSPTWGETIEMRVDDVRMARLTFTAVDKATPSIRKVTAALPSALAARALGAVRGTTSGKEQSATHDGEESARQRFAVMGEGTHELFNLQLLPGQPTPAEVKLERPGAASGGMAKSAARAAARMASAPLAMMTGVKRTGARDGTSREGREPTLHITVTFMPFVSAAEEAAAAAAAAGETAVGAGTTGGSLSGLAESGVPPPVTQAASQQATDAGQGEAGVVQRSSAEAQAVGAEAAAASAATSAAAAASLSSQFMGVLYVRLIRGEDMFTRDRSGRSDPFVKMRLGRQKRKSSTRYNTVQPVWEEEFEFIVGEQQLVEDQTIQVNVWDRDPFNQKDFMGSLELDTRAVVRRCKLAGCAVEERLELSETPTGALVFEFEFLSVATHAGYGVPQSGSSPITAAATDVGVNAGNDDESSLDGSDFDDDDTVRAGTVGTNNHWLVGRFPWSVTRRSQTNPPTDGYSDDAAASIAAPAPLSPTMKGRRFRRSEPLPPGGTGGYVSGYASGDEATAENAAAAGDAAVTGHSRSRKVSFDATEYKKSGSLRVHRSAGGGNGAAVNQRSTSRQWRRSRKPIKWAARVLGLRGRRGGDDDADLGGLEGTFGRATSWKRRLGAYSVEELERKEAEAAAEAAAAGATVGVQSRAAVPGMKWRRRHTKALGINANVDADSILSPQLVPTPRPPSRDLAPAPGPPPDGPTDAPAVLATGAEAGADGIAERRTSVGQSVEPPPVGLSDPPRQLTRHASVVRVRMAGLEGDNWDEPPPPRGFFAACLPRRRPTQGTPLLPTIEFDDAEESEDEAEAGNPAGA